jgi:glycosyltransferase involved in cell wall biosynthesis
VDPIAFVLPWYGPDVAGGAETDARLLAEHLCAQGAPVEVWTTCARGPGYDWSRDYHRPGRTVMGGVPVTRFPLTVMARERYWPIHRRLGRGGRAAPEEEALFLTLSIRSRALTEQIRARNDYLCVFTPYLYGTTYWGAYVAPERSLLMPCLHDEAFARIKAYRPLFRAIKGVLCNSPAERRLVQRLFGLDETRTAVLGDGIQTDVTGDGQAFKRRHALSTPFILYVGRKSIGKNTPLLLTYFRRYKQRRKSDLRLVMIGPGQVPLPPEYRQAVQDLGYLSETEKRNAFAAATIFCHPSVNESFSLVLMEAWVQGTAALVNARCDVTREHCEKAQGGLYFRNYQEFEAALDLLQHDHRLRRRLGENGRRYVARNFTWEQVTARFVNAVQRLCPSGKPSDCKDRG